MAGFGEVAAFNATSSTAKELGLFQVISRNCGYIAYHRTKHEKARKDAQRVFSFASELIEALPRGQGFNKISAQWLRDVRELLWKWDRLVENMHKDSNKLGADIDRLERANWYNIEGTTMEFTGNSKLSGWRFHKIGRTSAKVSEEAERLIKRHKDDLKEGDPTKVHKPAEVCCEFPIMKNMDKIIALECRAETMGRIRSSIHNHSSNFTVVYGAGGIGKTTMLVEIAQDIENSSNDFTRVVYVEVSRSPNIFQIQQKIAIQIGQPLEDANEDVARRADTLKRAINNTGYNNKKVLLVLDDVWEQLDMLEIGIPFGEKVKVVIGTRMSDLQWKDDDKIPVGLLTGEDPWKLFEAASKVGGTQVTEDAKRVAKECFGLPLALAVIGSTLRGEENKIIWEKALKYLQKSKIKKLGGKLNVEELLCKVIKYSYDYLDTKKVPMDMEDKIAREMFRLCCLFPENHDIPREDLMKYLTAEHPNVQSKHLDSAIIRLSKCHLLRSTVKPGILRMHAVVRDVAVHVIKEEGPSFIKCGTANAKTELSEETVTSNKIVSVMGSNIKETVGFPEYTRLARVAAYVRGKIAEKAEVAKVRILLLRGNTGLDQLPDSFFGRMGNLTVLDLSDTAIKGLPPSMHKLNKVQTLLLNGCKDLVDVREIAKLTGLRVLSLRESHLQSLRIGLDNLVNLKVLEFSSAGECEKNILDGIVILLPQLEELFLASKYLSDKAFMEIIELKKMTALRLCVYSNVLSSEEFDKKFENDSLFEKSEFPKWSEFTIFFKKEDEDTAPASEFTISGHLNYPAMSQKKNLHIMDLATANTGVKLLLREAENLIIEECFQEKKSLDFLTHQGEKMFQKTKSLHLKNCDKIQYLSSGGSSEWENLEVLELTELHKFEGIFEDTVSAGSFARLREVTFRNCEKIHYVMPNNVVQKVHTKLQKITVIKCDMVGYIFHHYPNHSDPFPVLNLIELRGLLILTTIWNQNPPQGTFAGLKELIVIECHKLTSVLTTTLAAMLTSLQNLTVENNKGLKEIVQSDGDTALDNKVFAKVTHVSMQKLEGLQNFHSNQTDTDLEWPSLLQLRLGGCDALTRFPIGQASAPYMKRVDVTSADDKPSPWYKKLEKLAEEHPVAHKKELEKQNPERKKDEKIIPHFVIRVAYDSTEEDE